MHLFEEDQHDCQCPVSEERSPPTILFNILSRKHYSSSSSMSTADSRRQYSLSHNCHCDQRRTVCLKDPEGVCQAASTVLVKTIRFMTSLPSFRHLPQRDQLVLLYNSWVPLFVLGLAQEHTEFEVTDSPANSILKRILLNTSDGGREMEEPAMPTLANVHKIKACLQRLWNLDLSPKEYAYIKGALLFNPDVPGLQAPAFIKSLQQEAHRALHEVIVTLHPQDQGRLLRILLTVSSLQTIPHSLVSELFFRPVVGQADLFQLIREILSPGTVTRCTAAEREWSKHCQQ
ncbi:nuclear receptor subfamily 0, group B, member 2b [Clupea harengus]|uniref:Nuclear receptor subfamily 0, group B, member 2b n=1 Tax=Clupea harengus TaxID=7950 RepID=A0A6P3W207_CLUHA|nr:nuclear receptor subfamily 0, group B, member 2b [Clupea harengus]